MSDILQQLDAVAKMGEKAKAFQIGEPITMPSAVWLDFQRAAANLPHAEIAGEIRRLRKALEHIASQSPSDDCSTYMQDYASAALAARSGGGKG